ncbi:hypothetical protein ACHAWT_002326 [Skeletonema menzelii]
MRSLSEEMDACSMASSHTNFYNGSVCSDPSPTRFHKFIDGSSVVLLGVFMPLVLCALTLLIYIVYKLKRTRYQLEKGRCNLPTVVWRPRFMNYTPKDDSGDDEEIHDYNEWARNFIKTEKLSKSTSSTASAATSIKQKMGSSAITNILPRMERLNGPYGMYATVYGFQTKVVHIAHPVPARAVLTGSGVIEVEDNHIEAKLNHGTHQSRRRSSTLRLLTGSTKYPAYNHFKNFSGNGVFTADGSDWKAKRASVLHCLVRGWNTDNLLEIEANRAADSFEREVSRAAESRNDANGDCATINVVPVLQRSTIGLIYRLITHQDTDFSSMDGISDNFLASSSSSTSSTTSSSSVSNSFDSDTLRKGKNEHGQNEDKIKSLLPLYLESVTKIRMILLAQSRSFWYLVPRWVYKLFSPMYREEERTMGPIREFARLTCENAAPLSPLALLSQRDSHSSVGNSEDGTVSKDILDEAITLLFAGQDTSAATLSWTLHLLSLNPEKRQKLEKEVRSVVQAEASNDTNRVTKSMVSQMPYLDATIKESMRLYPVAPFIVRKLTTDITIPNESGAKKQALSLPASTFACVWIYSLHRHPKLWDRPDEFLPERWIDPALRSNDLGQQEYGAYIPFAIGPRNCLGQPLAQVILRILLARIVNKYTALDPRFEALNILKEDDGAIDDRFLRKDMQAGFTVLPSNGLKLQLIERV